MNYDLYMKISEAANDVHFRQQYKHELPDIMGEQINDFYCCCRMCSFGIGLYLMALHCVFHGAFGLFLVITTSYRHINYTIHYCATSACGAFIFMGLWLFWMAVYLSWKGARLCGCFIAIITLYNLAAFIAYFAYYIEFDANSLMDSDLYWRNDKDWVKATDYPFTFWHLQTVFYILFTLHGWYYAIVLCKSIKVLKLAAGVKFQDE